MWDFVDSINCITVKKSKRLDGLINNLNQVGISPKNINVWTFIKAGENEGGKNCSLFNIFQDIFFGTNNCCDKVCKEIHNNHKKIIEKCYNSGCSSTMIFEDDARFNLPFESEKMERIKYWMKNNDWDIIYLGSLPVIPLGIPVTKDIVKPSFPILMHSYILSRSGMKKILDLNNNSHIDLEIARSFNIKKYCVYPSINIQSEQPHMTPWYMTPFYDTFGKTLEFIHFYSIFIIILILFYFYILR